MGARLKNVILEKEMRARNYARKEFFSGNFLAVGMFRISLFLTRTSRTIDMRSLVVKVILLYISTATALFVRKGFYAPAIETNFRVAVPVSKAAEKIKLFERVLAKVEKHYKLNERGLSGRAVHSLRERVKSLSDKIESIDGLCPASHHRHRRFWGMIVGAAAMTLAIRNSIELASLEGRVDTIIEETVVVLDDLTRKVEELDRRLAALKQEETLEEFVVLFEIELSRFEEATDIIQESMSETFRGQFPSRLFAEKGRTKMIAQMALTARKWNLRMPLAQQDLFRARVSAACSDGILEILIHVPMMSDSLELYNFVSVPSPIANVSEIGKMIVIEKIPRNERWIAVDNSRSVYLELGDDDLRPCFRIEDFYVCQHGSLIYKKDFRDTCIAALFVREEAAALSTCEVRVRQLKEVEFFEAGNGEFIVNSPHEFDVVINCQNGSRSEMKIVRGLQKMRVEPGCYAVVSNKFRLEHLPTVSMTNLDNIDLTVAASYKELIPNEHDLNCVFEYFDQQESAPLPGKSFEELHHIIAHIKSQRETTWLNYLKLAIGGFLLVMIVCVYMYRKCRRRRLRNEKLCSTKLRRCKVARREEFNDVRADTSSFDVEELAAHVRP